MLFAILPVDPGLPFVNKRLFDLVHLNVLPVYRFRWPLIGDCFFRIDGFFFQPSPPQMPRMAPKERRALHTRVEALSQAGCSYAQIAAKEGISKSTVAAMVRRFRERGSSSRKQRSDRGVPKWSVQYAKRQKS